MIRSLAFACALLLLPVGYAAAGEAKIVATPDRYRAYDHEFNGVFCTSPEAAADFAHSAWSLSDQEVVGYIPRFNAGRADVCGVDTITVFDLPQMVNAYESGDGPCYIYEFSPGALPRLYSWTPAPLAVGPEYHI